MSDEDLDIDDPDDTPVITKLRTQLRALKSQVQELGEKASAGETAIRKLAFSEAGVDLTDPKTKYFVEGYKGDLTAEAIKAEAVEAGFLTPVENPEPANDGAALGRIVDASAPRVPDGEPSIDDRIAAAERDGDFTTSRLLKNQKVSARFGA